jgi:hypothetical protein
MTSRRITVRRFASAAEADRHDLEFWRQFTDGERVIEAWRLSEEQWRLRGEFPTDPDVCRTHARLIRNRSTSAGS